MDSTAMTTSSQTHLLLLLLLSATIAATADQQQPSTAAQTTLPGCPDKCGNVSIPYPFGMTTDCFLPGFQVTCNDTFDPPRAFFAANLSFDNLDKPHILIEHFSYSMNEKNMPYRPINRSLLPVELTGVSVSEGKARVQAAFSFDCRLDKGYHAVREQEISFPYRSPFLLSEASNVLMGIGTVVEAEQTTGPGCQSYLNPLAVPSVEPVNGSCSGQGCCQAKVPPSRSGATVKIKQQQFDDFDCSYAMIVEKSWYNFSSPDLYGDDFLRRNAARGVPVVVDFHIPGHFCPQAGQPAPEGYACKSGNSTCVDPPKNYDVLGYFCRCWDGYEGNPYIPRGCQDIDECKRPDLYPCHGKCQNRQGSYECTCPVGTRGNATEGRCTDLFPLPAKVSLGAIGGLFVIALVVFLILLRQEKRKMREFFIKNGGPTLENARNIKIYRREDLKPILKRSNFVGKGAFGEVYKGLLDNQLVAVKKPINGSVTHNEQFANEVNIQSRVIHKNIVRLIGCCLEVDIPMLVYEFLSKGSLDEILHGSSRVPLDLDRRLNIAAESAEGLAYMNSKTTSKILHGDVKPANILLDHSFVPKISDFGISRLIAIDKQHTNSVIGDMSYMDPAYLQTGLLSDKSDVYSFGIVLLELISRKKATYSDNNSLVKNFLDAHKMQKRATELFDDEIAAPKDLELLDSLVAIAVECLNLDVEQRPEMTDVAERLLMLKRSWYK